MRRGGEGRERIEDQEGRQEELKDELRLMRFIRAERKRDRKNGVALQNRFDPRKLS